MNSLKFQNKLLAAIGQYCFKNHLYSFQRKGTYAFHFKLSRVGYEPSTHCILSILIIDNVCTLTFKDDIDPFLRSSKVKEIMSYIENAIILDELTGSQL